VPELLLVVAGEVELVVLAEEEVDGEASLTVISAEPLLP
jgi:hypothetical protein